jgi:pSer/pThr/pTyr-binding forkhead associated (FHA) protein
MGTCNTCGVETADGAAFCDHCDAALEGATESFSAITDETPLAQAEPVEGRTPVLVVGKGAEIGERFYLESGTLSVGRDPACDIFLNDVTVSREHAMLHTAGGAVTVEDTGSLNGTYVNGVLVDSATLRNGDALQVGRFQMVFLAGGGE